jgi:DNA-binding transcriptional MerR regulator
MARTYSITEAARLLGVSAATVSRRIPAERVSRGRAAGLSLQEILEVARQAQLDLEAVRRRATLDAEYGLDMPADARHWAEIAAERGLVEALALHVARIPEDLLECSRGEEPDFAMPEPWGDPAEWTPVTSAEELEALVPPPAP